MRVARDLISGLLLKAKDGVGTICDFFGMYVFQYECVSICMWHQPSIDARRSALNRYCVSCEISLSLLCLRTLEEGCLH